MSSAILAIIVTAVGGKSAGMAAHGARPQERRSKNNDGNCLEQAN